MKIWQRNFTIAQLNEFIPCTAMAALDIEFTEFGDDYLKARMPVTDNSSQPMGYLHGGASALLAESVASMAGNMCCELDYACLGQEFPSSMMRLQSRGSASFCELMEIFAGNDIFRISMVCVPPSTTLKGAGPCQ